MANWMKLMKDQDSGYERNLEFLKAYRETGDEEALEWLILNNANLVHKIVGKYRTFYNHRLSYDDLFSVGLEGLLRAIEKFDFSYSNNFATYASYWVKQSVVRLISDEGFPLKIPAHIFETMQQLVREELASGGSLSRKEAYQRLGINAEKYDLIQQVRAHVLKWSSLNRPLSGEDETEVGDLLIQDENVINLTSQADDLPDRFIEHNELQAAISKGLNFLDEREQLIIIHRFGLFGAQVKTLAEIGRSAGISRERIRQLEVRAIRKLKKVMRGYEDYI
ncbi:MAG: sigma-70 family RNA polymerase sigma factor [Turicibacter sp.]|nr:sigma-70 family RNA polymerase sigma factor [Turicibacter sp.]